MHQIRLPDCSSGSRIAFQPQYQFQQYLPRQALALFFEPPNVSDVPQ
jgi:hypothetical protein